jgi:hypothetical protein
MVIVRPDWSFDDAWKQACSRYRGSGRTSAGARIGVLRSWGAVVGRARATAAFREHLGSHGSHEAAAYALDIAESTLRKLGRFYASLAETRDALGLTLTFDGRLHRFDATAFDVMIAAVLGVDTDVTIEERSNVRADRPVFIRINGSKASDLVDVAEAFYRRLWRLNESGSDQPITSEPSGLALLLDRLDKLRDNWVAASLADSPGEAAQIMNVGRLSLEHRAARRRIEGLSARVEGEHGARRSLVQLVSGLFLPGALHAWVGAELGPDIADGLPGPTATHADVVGGLIGVLERRGRVDRLFFDGLAAHNPDQQFVVREVAARFGVLMHPDRETASDSTSLLRDAVGSR